jgi:endonuclease/exonuclease/phosphatase family metal-dependent hydrolase
MTKLFLLLFSLLPLTASAETLKVLSWNVYMLPKPLKESLQSTRQRVIPQELKKSQHDIFFLQEAFMGSFRSEAVRVLKKTHPHQIHLNKWRGFPFFSSGLHVISRYPIKSVDWTYFRNCADADCFSTKGVILIEVTLPSGKKLHVANTHLQSGRRFAEVRRQQMDEVRRLLDRYEDPKIPQVLLGDLNIADTESEYAWSLNLLGFKPLPLVGPIRTTSSRVNPCYKTGNSPDWVDHIWYRNLRTNRSSNMQVRVFDFQRGGDTCPLSDHHAVEAELRI